MNKGTTLQELVKELDRQNEAKRDFNVNTKDHLIMNDDASLHIVGKSSDIDRDPERGDLPFDVSNHAHSQIASRIQIPKKYYDRMREESPELLAENVNHWFQEKPEVRMVRTMDGNARAFMSDKYRCLDNFDMARVALGAIGDLEAQVKSCQITESKLYLQVVTPRITTDVKLDDTVQAGFIISNSEVGSGSLKVQPLVYRLACLNGMIVNDASMRKYHVGRSVADLGNDASEILRDDTKATTDTAFWMTVRDIIMNAVSEEGFMNLTRKMVQSTEVKISADPVDVIERVKTKFRMTDAEGAGVYKNLLINNDMSQWGLLNAVTQQAHTTEDYDRSVELESMGGEILGLSQTDWSKLDATAA